MSLGAHPHISYARNVRDQPPHPSKLYGLKPANVAGLSYVVSALSTTAAGLWIASHASPTEQLTTAEAILLYLVFGIFWDFLGKKGGPRRPACYRHNQSPGSDGSTC